MCVFFFIVPVATQLCEPLRAHPRCFQCDPTIPVPDPLQGLKELAEWVNPEYLAPSMADQCAAAFNENGSTIQLHRFLKVPNRDSAKLRKVAGPCVCSPPLGVA